MLKSLFHNLFNHSPGQVTLITCSYNAPRIFELCLKSFVFHHGRGPHKIVVIENSTVPGASSFLDSNNIPYHQNPGGTHSPSVDIALDKVRSRYALLMDTDIIFKKHIGEVIRTMKDQGISVLGELQGDRGGFSLYPRIAPYFCLIDVDRIRSCRIRFHDEYKINLTSSGGFFKNLPLNFEDKTQKFYDVGSTFLEGIKNHHLKISDFQRIRQFVFHAESLSWATASGMNVFIEMGKLREEQFYNESKDYSKISIKNCFCSP